MSEREKQTRFLKELIRTECCDELESLKAQITKAERDERCIRSALWLMLVLALLSAAGLGYSAVFVREFFENATPAIVKVFSALVLASMICLVGFLGFWVWTRQICNRLYEDCRNLIISLHRPPTPPGNPFPPASSMALSREDFQVYTIVTPQTGHEAQIISIPQSTFVSQAS
jgi:hypothetical protein